MRAGSPAPMAFTTRLKLDASKSATAHRPTCAGQPSSANLDGLRAYRTSRSPVCASRRARLRPIYPVAPRIAITTLTGVPPGVERRSRKDCLRRNLRWEKYATFWSRSYWRSFDRQTKDDVGVISARDELGVIFRSGHGSPYLAIRRERQKS